MHRAYSVLEIKAVDDDARIIEGIATTPSTDRMGDIVEPEGAEYTLPIPLLWQHNSREPIGEVFFAKVSAKGIEIKARIAKIAEEGKLKDRLDEAWQSIKAKLVRGLSIGFNPLEDARIENTFGFRFLKWEWLELSAVTIPANVDASIQTVKSHDVGAPAADGTGASVSRRTHPGAPGSVKSHTPKPPKGTMTITEQVKQYEASRAAKMARMDELMKAANDAGSTLDQAQEEEHDTLETEVEAIDKHLTRLRKAEARNKAAAVPVTGKDAEGASQARSGTPIIRVEKQLAPGLRFARVAKCLWHSRQQFKSPEEIAATLYPDDALTQKAAVAAGNTASGWASDLVGDETSVFADFAEFLRPQTILGKFGTGGIPSLRRVPFRVPLIIQTGGGAGYWVGEGAPKPLTALDFDRTTLTELKVANIAVVTKELLRQSSPSADGILRDQLAAALRERLDIDFIDPAKAASAGVSPASITNAATPITSSGNDADAVRADVGALIAAFIAANNPPTQGVLVMPSQIALQLSLMVNALGQPEFGGITMAGGTLLGLPVIASEYVPVDSGGAFVVLVNASDIYLGDEGGVSVSVSDQASLQMLDTDVSGAGAPTVNSVTPTATSLVSMFQTNSVAFLAEQIINWKLRRSTAVQVLDDVNWSAAAA